MHLVSRDLFDIDCGSWDVIVGLAKEQPITTIDFIQNGADTGVFNADLVLTAQITFVNIDDPSDTRVLTRTVHFTEFIHAPYRILPEAPTRAIGKRGGSDRSFSDAFKVDSDADGIPDKDLVLGLTVYQNGYYCEQAMQQKTQMAPLSVDGCVHETVVHTAPNHNHATTPTNPTCIICPPDETSHYLERTGHVDGRLTEADRQAMLVRLRLMEAAGNLVVPAEQLVDEVFEKGTN